MQYGLWLTASGMMTNLHKQDVIAQNIANVNTPGFKQDMMNFMQRDPEVDSRQLPFNMSLPLLDKLGGAPWVHSSYKSFEQGPLHQTGNDLNVAIQGDGFFVLQKPDGQGGNDLRLTRDGRMSITKEGQLIQTGTNLPYLDINDEPIMLNTNEMVEIDRYGIVRQNNIVRGQMQITKVDDPNLLADRGEGQYAMSEQQAAARRQVTLSEGELHQRFLEGSNVQPVHETVNMIEASRAIQMQANLMRMHQTILEQAVGRLPRVSA